MGNQVPSGQRLPPPITEASVYDGVGASVGDIQEQGFAIENWNQLRSALA